MTETEHRLRFIHLLAEYLPRVGVRVEQADSISNTILQHTRHPVEAALKNGALGEEDQRLFLYGSAASIVALFGEERLDDLLRAIDLADLKDEIRSLSNDRLAEVAGLWGVEPPDGEDAEDPLLAAALFVEGLLSLDPRLRRVALAQVRGATGLDFRQLTIKRSSGLGSPPGMVKLGLEGCEKFKNHQHCKLVSSGGEIVDFEVSWVTGNGTAQLTPVDIKRLGLKQGDTVTVLFDA
ncbi:MAG: hypothetical protein GF403_07955 [Candidatus Coatesbacteria bacterium]|nr:hypothetical protein [Candidatus Coatesbacteria bacterium]